MKNLSAFTKLLIAIIFTILAVMVHNSAKAQGSKFNEEWTFFAGTDKPITFTGKGYERIVLEPKDTATYVYTILREKKQWRYDSIWTPTYYNNDDPAIIYAPADKWAIGKGQSKFLNSDFHYRKGIGSPRTAVFSITTNDMIRIKFFSEHFAGHGKYTISVDGGTPITINAGDTSGNKDGLSTDKDLNKPSFTSKVLLPGTHSLLLSTEAQMVFDFISVEKLTTKIKG